MMWIFRLFFVVICFIIFMICVCGLFVMFILMVLVWVCVFVNSVVVFSVVVNFSMKCCCIVFFLLDWFVLFVV